MPLRAIHLTTPNRLREIARQFGVNVPPAWLGNLLFEWRVTDKEQLLELKYWLDKNGHSLLKVDAEKRTLLFKPGEISDEPVSRPLPRALQDEWEKIRLFLQHNPPAPWQWGEGRTLHFDRGPIIMGILNVTPDSFSDGGKFFDVSAAVERALRMAEEGAQIIDVGGESTRPGAEPVPLKEEMRRVLPVIEALRRKSDILISIDTYKSEVARQALQAGADIVNDISGARFDENMPRVVAEFDVPLIIMHIKGMPKNMQKNPYYSDAVGEIYSYFEERLEFLQRQGIKHLAIDPGIGFGKRLEDNLKLLRDLKDFTFLNRPILMGTSRKSFIGLILNKEVDERLFGSLSAQVVAVQNGAHMVRVHDVAATHDALKIWQAIVGI